MMEAGTDAVEVTQADVDALLKRLQSFVDFWRERGQFSGEVSAFEAAIEGIQSLSTKAEELAACLEEARERLYLLGDHHLDLQIRIAAALAYRGEQS